MAVFIKLTRLDGVPVWIRADSIMRVSQPIDRADANATINADGFTQDVKEYAPDVVKMIEASNGQKS
jgi:hypothetical protein